MDFREINEKVWDNNVENENCWTVAVSSEEVERAREGLWEIKLTPYRPIPRNWFPEVMKGKKILCLASGGGQQGPILAAAGAEVTVFDLSEAQLKQDRLVAKRDNLDINTVKGDMKDLTCFKDETFDLVVHPWSNSYVDDIQPVWKECYRVLKKNGVLISGFSNGLEYIFDLKSMNEGKLVFRHKLPYSDLTSISEAERRELIVDQGEGLCFGHTLEQQIQGQINAGFVIAGFMEDAGGTLLDDYVSGSINTKAIKL